MSNPTYLIGYIQEWYKSRQEDREVFCAANDRALQALPVDDSYPPLCRSMVSVTGPDSAHGSFRGGRLIYFGGHFNYIVEDLQPWLEKFEALLSRLFWSNAELRIDGGWLGPSFVLRYSICGDTVAQYHNCPQTAHRSWDLKVYANREGLFDDDRLPTVLGASRCATISNYHPSDRKTAEHTTESDDSHLP